MMAIFDTDIFKQIFGFAPLSGLGVEESDRFRRKLGVLGTQPIDQIPKNGIYATRIDTFTFDIPPLVSVSREKNVKITERFGSNLPPVVKIIGMGVARVTIKGYIKTEEIYELGNGMKISKPALPYEIISKLNRLFEKNEALDIENELLATYSINRIVLVSQPSFVIASKAIGYEFAAIHDEDAELQEFNQ